MVRATAATVVVIIVVIVPSRGVRCGFLLLLGLLRWMALIFLSPVAAVLVRRVAVSAVVPVVAVPAAVLVAVADVVAHERVGNPVENVGEKTLVARKRGRLPPDRPSAVATAPMMSFLRVSMRHLPMRMRLKP